MILVLLYIFDTIFLTLCIVSSLPKWRSLGFVFLAFGLVLSLLFLIVKLIYNYHHNVFMHFLIPLAFLFVGLLIEPSLLSGDRRKGKV
jgi:hypothetical protein